MIYFLLGFAPGIYWLIYFYKRDKLDPEPRKLVIAAYFLGIAVAFLVMLIQLPINASYFVSAIIMAPIIEEVGKYLTVRVTMYNNKAFNEPMDGIIYASAVALGFASIENGFYLLRASNVSQELLTNVIFIRSLLSVPGHALFSSHWGFALGRKKFSSGSKGIVFRGLLQAILLHALFNFLCLLNQFSAIGLIILLDTMWHMIRKKMKTAALESPFLEAALSDQESRLDQITDPEE